MTLKDKVQKVCLEMMEGKDSTAISKEIKEKIGKELVNELTETFQQQFGKFIHLKGEEYIKPLIKSMKRQEIEEVVKEILKERDKNEMA